MTKHAWIVVVLAACGPSAGSPSGNGVADAPAAQPDSDNGGGGSGGGGGGGGSYLVYAHSDTVLYSIDLSSHQLVTVGNFNAPNNDVITDLAVAPSGTLYAISNTTLYTADANDGHVTSVGSLSTCGSRAVALTTTPDGNLWTGDYTGKLCQIDISQATPVVKPPITMSGGLALSGDFVAVDNGTVFGTAYKLSDASNTGTNMNNLLVTIDLTSGTTTQIGSSGFPKLFGAAYQEGMVFGFTHDGSGRVVTIDRMTGQGTLFGTFTDPSTMKGISFAGAAVNSLVVIQ
jgi:hypothetical protein